MVVHLRGTRRCAGDDGTAVVETAFVAPVFFFIIFGILEYSRLFMSYQGVANTTINGARGAAILGNDSAADFSFLAGIKAGSRGINTNNIVRIVIWHATDARSKITVDAPGCAAGNTFGHTLTSTENSQNAAALSSGMALPHQRPNYCNVYVPADLNRPLADFGCQTTDIDQFYCPFDRRAANSGPASADYVGVYVVYTHPFLTGLFGNSRTLTNLYVIRIEPHTFS